MIRREVPASDNTGQWLLISQVEHARISHLLAKHCLSHIPEAIYEELLLAVLHHDDGWETWDCHPPLATDLRRPLSFRELPHADSLPIWGASIEHAAKLGPLAGWIVAQHFLALLRASEKLATLESWVLQWKQQVLLKQARWFSQWESSSPKLHTQSLAEEALRWLQLLDVASLWLCSACPTKEEVAASAPKDYLFASKEPHETLFSFKENIASMSPWKLDLPQLTIEAKGWMVAAQKYSDTAELLACREERTFRWDFAKIT